jgi:hypothetical protein
MLAPARRPPLLPPEWLFAIIAAVVVAAAVGVISFAIGQ